MATYKHLRSSTANKRPTTSITDGQLAINTNTASPGLFFKDSAGTGIVKVGPVHVGTTAPNATPAAGGSSGNYLGEQWLDTSVSPAQMKVWNGSAWVGIVADELPVSKLQDGDARQLLQTDAAGTGVEWTSNVDVPGTLDVTSTATFDSIARHPLGSAAAPTLTFTGDPNTGIYSPGADQVAVATNGAGRLFVDASGNVGVKGSTVITTSAISAPTFQIGDGAGSPAVVMYSAPTGASQISFADSTTGTGSYDGYILYDQSSQYFSLGTASTERLRITSAGLVGIGTSSPGYTLDVAGTFRSTGIARLGTGQTTTLAYIGNPDTAGNKYITFGRASALTDIVNIQGVDAGVGSANIALQASGGNVGIGTTSPGSALEINAAAATSPFIAKINTAEAARIDSSGRLLVGTSTSRSVLGLSPSLQLEAATGYVGPSFTSNANDSSGSYLHFTKSRGTSLGSNTVVANNDNLGTITFNGTDGSAAVEAARISVSVDGTPALTTCQAA
jgi:hypothetical protein